MAMSSLTYIPGFSVKFFFQPIYTDYAIVKGTLPRTILARFGLIWFRGFRGKDLNVIFYQNMPNLHNRYKSADRNISQKNQEYMCQFRPNLVEWSLDGPLPKLCPVIPTSIYMAAKNRKKGG
jgi:hypothetical protein